MTKAISPKLLKALVVLKNANVPLKISEMQKLTGLPIAAISKFMWECKESFTLELVRKIDSETEPTYEFINTTATINMYDMLLEGAGLKDDTNTSGANTQAPAASNQVNEAASVAIKSKPVKATKKPAAPKIQEPVATADRKKTASSELAKPTENSNAPTGTEISMDTVVQAFNGKSKTLPSLLEAMKVGEDKLSLVQAVLDRLTKEGHLKTKKVMNSTVYRPASDIFVKVAESQPTPEESNVNQDASSAKAPVRTKAARGAKKTPAEDKKEAVVETPEVLPVKKKGTRKEQSTSAPEPIVLTEPQEAPSAKKKSPRNKLVSVAPAQTQEGTQSLSERLTTIIRSEGPLSIESLMTTFADFSSLLITRTLNELVDAGILKKKGTKGSAIHYSISNKQRPVANVVAVAEASPVVTPKTEAAGAGTKVEQALSNIDVAELPSLLRQIADLVERVLHENAKLK